MGTEPQEAQKAQKIVSCALCASCGFCLLLLLVYGSGGAAAARSCLPERAAVRQCNGNEQPTGVTVLKRTRRKLYLVAGFDRCGLPAGTYQVRRWIHLQVPDLRVAFCVFDL